MPRRLPPSFRAAIQSGASLIEVLVGLLIGMVVVAVIYNTLIVAETYRRNTTGLSDAQVTGQLAQYLMGREIATAGGGFMAYTGIDVLARCADWHLRPIPVLITDSGNVNTSDSIAVFYSNATRVVHPVRFSALATYPAPYPVESPNGFKTGDWIIAANATNCTLGQVTGITQYPSGDPYPPAGDGGKVLLAYSRKSGPASNYDTGSRVVNLGQDVARTIYSVDATKAQLQSATDNPAVAAVTSPLAQNVVLLKAQYGIDTTNTGVVDCWTSAVTAGCGGDYSATNLKADPAPGGIAGLIRNVKAVRVAVVVRSEDVAKEETISAQDKGSVDLKNQTAWLFNCAANDATCQGRIQIDNTVLQDYGRYRVYEATIPLRNTIWNYK